MSMPVPEVARKNSLRRDKLRGTRLKGELIWVTITHFHNCVLNGQKYSTRH